MNIVNLIHL